MFTLNKAILEEGRLVKHFMIEPEVKSLFTCQGIDFMCKRGKHNRQNQDNMFIIIDGSMKLFGVFDGYGPKGHLVSAFA